MDKQSSPSFFFAGIFIEGHLISGNDIINYIWEQYFVVAFDKPVSVIAFTAYQCEWQIVENKSRII